MKDKIEKMKTLVADARALDELIVSQADGATEEQATQLEQYATDIPVLQGTIEAEEKLAARASEIRAAIAGGVDFLAASAGRVTAGNSAAPMAQANVLGMPVVPNVAPITQIVPVTSVIPATVKRYGSLRNFKGPDAEVKAYRFGMFCMAAMGRPIATEWCNANGVPLIQSVHKEGTNVAGGVLVPEEFDNDMIDLKELFGVARQYARIVPMGSDTKRRLRRTGGLTAYPVGEGAAGTESTKSWDQVNLTAKDWMVLATYTADLNEDSVMSIGDDLAGEAAYAFASSEDECMFNGDGTFGSYHGIVGVRPKILGLSSTRANIAGLVVGAGNLWSELTLANFESVVSLLPTFADRPTAVWFVHKVFWHTVMASLARAAGGNTAADLQAGLGMQFLGYKVVPVQVMPKTEANDQVCALLGELSLAADFGDRRQNVISFSDTATIGGVSMFETNQLAIRATERFDINVHDVGNATGTAADKVEGPIVGLLTAAS